MKALLKTGPGPYHLAWTDADEPIPGPGDVQLELIAAGLCHTDLGMINGDYGPGSGYSPAFPLVLGHEYLGRVVALGEGVADLEVGTRVVGSTHLTCGHCRWCLRGRSMLCTSRRVIGLDVDGVWAERFVLPRVNVVAVPDGVSDRLAVLAEPFAVAAHAVDQGRVREGERVAVVGPGTVGLLTVGALTGHAPVVIGRREDAVQLERAVQYGASSVAYSDGAAGSPQGDAASLFGEFDVVFETAGSSAAVTLGTKLLAPGGRLICVGLPGDSASISSAQLAWQERSIIGSRAYDRSTWATVPAKLAAAPALEAIVSHEVALADYERALRLVESREATKVLLHL